MNTHKDPETSSRLVRARGIPGYNESNDEFTLSLCLLASMFAGYSSYARLMELAQEDAEAAEFHKIATSVQRFISSYWWDDNTNSFFGLTDCMGHPRHSESQGHDLLYWRVFDSDERTQALLQSLVGNVPQEPSLGVERQSHLPEVFYRYGAYEAAYKQLQYLAKGPRNQYPEASFSAIGAITEGLMGIEVEYHAPIESLKNGGYVGHIVTTTPRLTDATGYAGLSNVPINANKISIEHKGQRQITACNQHGPSLILKARIPGVHDHLMVNGERKPCTHEVLPTDGISCSTVSVVIGAGETKTITAQTE